VILDSSVLIAAERGNFDLEGLLLSFGDQASFMSSITLSELWHGCHRASAPARSARIKHVQHLESIIPILAFSTQEALIHSKIWSKMEASGNRIGYHDLIIAATALCHDHSLATLNDTEFSRVAGLRLTPVKGYIRN
jgi:tRNA(fMet)-specific endonuclease VapC